MLYRELNWSANIVYKQAPPGEDGQGVYESKEGRWTGIVGQLLTGVTPPLLDHLLLMSTTRERW